MAYISLTRGLSALVDDEDVPLLAQYKWCSVKTNQTNWYAHAGVPTGKRRQPGDRNIYMHRLILGLKPGDPSVDHINGDGLDNRKLNLRLVTAQQNQRNRHHNRKSTSQYKGVDWHKKAGKWRASITINGSKQHLGLFLSEREAAECYDNAAGNMFGMFACTNFGNVNRSRLPVRG